MRLLVTGGAGFIGSNFVHYWLRAHPGDRLVILDALTYAGNLSSLASALELPDVHFVRGDICDRALVETLLRDEQLSTIVHFAAESHVDRSIAGPDVFVRTNVQGTQSLLEAARKVWLQERTVETHRFHHVSTDEVFGSLGPTDPAFTEVTPYMPNSPYAASKAGADHLVRAYHHTYGLGVSISNCSNNYGPFHFPEKLIPLMIVNILSGRPLPVYGDGSNIRDWLHVTDHCRGIDLILSRGSAGVVYNVGGRAERTNLDLLHLLCAVADQEFRKRPDLRSRYPQCPASRGESTISLLQFVADRPGHDRRYAIDCGKIEKDLGFKPSVTLETGLRDTFSWYVDNESWWRSVMNGSYQQWIDSHYKDARHVSPPASADVTASAL